MLYFVKANRKKMNAGEMEKGRVWLSQKSLERDEKYKRVKQYQ